MPIVRDPDELGSMESVIRDLIADQFATIDARDFATEIDRAAAAVMKLLKTHVVGPVEAERDRYRQEARDLALQWHAADAKVARAWALKPDGRYVKVDDLRAALADPEADDA